MKKTILILSALSVAQMGVAQTNTSGVAIGSGPAVSVSQPGTYDQQQLNRTAVVMKVMDSVDPENKVLIQSIIKDAERSVESLRQLVNGGNGSKSLQQIQKEGLAQTAFIGIEDFVEIRGKLADNISRVEQAIDMLNTVSTKDGKTSLTIEGKAIDIPARATQEVRETANVLKKAVDSVKAQTDNLIFRVSGGATQGGAPYDLKLSSEIPPILMQLAGSKLTDLRNKNDAKLRAPEAVQAKDKAFTASRGLNTETRNRINAVIAVMGKGNVGQIWNMNKDGMASALNDLQEIMIARMALRYNFGTPIGAIGVDYKKYFFNLDQIGLGNKIEFVQSDIYSYAGLVAIQDANKLQYEKAKRKSQEVFGPGVPLLSRILSGINKITLREAWGEVNTYVMDLLLQDAEQELLMHSAIGKDKLYDNLSAKLSANKEWASKVKPLIKAYNDAIENPQANAAISSGNLTMIYQTAVGALQGWEGIWLDYIMTKKSIDDRQAGLKTMATGGKKARSLNDLTE